MGRVEGTGALVEGSEALGTADLPSIEAGERQAGVEPS